MDFCKIYAQVGENGRLIVFEGIKKSLQMVMFKIKCCQQNVKKSKCTILGKAFNGILQRLAWNS